MNKPSFGKVSTNSALFTRVLPTVYLKMSEGVTRFGSRLPFWQFFKDDKAAKHLALLSVINIQKKFLKIGGCS
jgi:hypothetical protein